MRRPTQIECLYLDFDGFFASVEQTAHPELRGLPVGVVPFTGTDRTCVIACSREAKLLGVKNVMNVNEARALCPDIVLVPQSPDLYRRAHNALLSEISAVLPIDAVKSIDELTCRVEPSHRADPQQLGRRIKERIAAGVGPYITCSIGFAANRQLAKMACKAGKQIGRPLRRRQQRLASRHDAGAAAQPVARRHSRRRRPDEAAPGARRHRHDGGPARHAAEAHAGAVGQRERRAALVRAARLSGACAAIVARHVRARPRAAA